MAEAFTKGGKPGPGRPKGCLNKTTQEAQAFARGIVTSPKYRQTLKEQAEAGTLAPALQQMLWAYWAGKPPDKVELTGADQGPLNVIFGGRYRSDAA